MGWWELDDSKNVMGDDPADIISKAIDDIIKCYENYWKRKPTMIEVKANFDFVYESLPKFRGLKK